MDSLKTGDISANFHRRIIHLMIFPSAKIPVDVILSPQEISNVSYKLKFVDRLKHFFKSKVNYLTNIL